MSISLHAPDTSRAADSRVPKFHQENTYQDAVGCSRFPRFQSSIIAWFVHGHKSSKVGAFQIPCSTLPGFPVPPSSFPVPQPLTKASAFRGLVVLRIHTCNSLGSRVPGLHGYMVPAFQASGFQFFRFFGGASYVPDFKA